MPISIKDVRGEQTFSLRAQILRPDVPLSKVHFTGENAPDTRHFAAFEDEKIVGAAYVMATNFNGQNALQMRGVCVHSIIKARESEPC